MKGDLRIFVGWDGREPAAASVLMHSIAVRQSAPVYFVPLIRRTLGNAYTRERMPTESTEFSFTRFLVPYLSRYEGWSIFMDCDMLCQADIWELMLETISQRDKAVLVCQHNYLPKGFNVSQNYHGLTHELDAKGVPFLAHSECGDCRIAAQRGEYVPAVTKMQGQVQTAYPRKNWSSLMVFNNAQCRQLTRQYVNAASGSDLHQFAWVPDEQIGSLPIEWNWLSGEYAPNPDAKIIHYTLGGPWWDQYRDCDHADLWLRERDAMLGAPVGVPA